MLSPTERSTPCSSTSASTPPRRAPSPTTEELDEITISLNLINLQIKQGLCPRFGTCVGGCYY